ncbi:DAK2 domain-containing protein [Ornithinimicrobium sp. W1665]|uniref:DAK2 domain-containing protein n=1 Tax=Ornithinimicrobium sp. W1665 TaxID=3416666 RepID=UPI003CEF82C7
MPPPVLDLVTARRWAVTARSMLASARERIDALNVYPVADGDTGTNMYLTMDGALDFVRGQFELGAGTERLDEGLALIARGMLLSARGNSGVILSQLARGLAESVGPGVRVAGPVDLAVAFETAAGAAWDAVAAPVEGTILSVATAAAEGARGVVDAGGTQVADVVAAALQSARVALARTPEQLPELRSAGVVDAGGAGLVVVVEALDAVLQERPHVVVSELPRWWEVPTTGSASSTGSSGRRVPGDHGAGAGAPGCLAAAGTDQVEVMYLLTGSDPGRADRLRAHLGRLGDSVAVAGGPHDYRVHVHLRDPRAAVEAGSSAGQVEDVRLTSLTDGRSVQEGPADGDGHPQGERGAAEEGGPGLTSDHPDPTEHRLDVVVCALGPGLHALFSEAGAQVVPSGPRRRASAGQLLSALWGARAAHLVLLPNDPDTVMVARAAAQEARSGGLVVDVLPTTSVVEGLAALAVLDPDAEPGPTVAAMAEAAAGVRSGALTPADRDADTPVGRVRRGQWLGLVDGTVVAVGERAAEVAAPVLDQLWHPAAEVVTVVRGERSDAEDLDPVLDDVLAEHPDVEVVRLDGGQPTFPWLLGVE